jgi:hypothetical protein
MTSARSHMLFAAAVPPPPWRVAEYFAGRRGGLSQPTDEDLAHNDRLWRKCCGLPDDSEPGIAAQEGLSAGADGAPVSEAATETAPPTRRSKSYICEDCGGQFVAKRRARFCSVRCQVAVFRACKARHGRARPGGCAMSVFVVIAFCMIGHPGVCQEIAGEEVVGLAARAISGQQTAARWLAEHPKWALQRVRCSVGNRPPINTGS